MSKYQGNHTSTETQERFYHINLKCGLRGTVFFRTDVDGTIYGSTAITSPGDNFCRATGRTISRRHWFAGRREAVADTSYETASALIESVAERTTLRRWELVEFRRKGGVVSFAWVQK